MRPNDTIISAAVKASNNVSFINQQHGAVVYNKDGILSTGWNKRHKVPSLGQYGYYYCMLHAETDAILKAPSNKLQGASLLVVRNGKTKLKNSRPCDHCWAIISEVGIKDTWYSDVHGMIVCG